MLVQIVLVAALTMVVAETLKLQRSTNTVQTVLVRVRPSVAVLEPPLPSPTRMDLTAHVPARSTDVVKVPNTTAN